MSVSRDALGILLLTDVFPPKSGGSGWSTYYLGRALQERGHSVSVVRPVFGEGVSRPARRVVEYGGMTIEEIVIPTAPAIARRLGYAKAYEENAARKLLAVAAVRLARRERLQVLHGGHAISAVAASVAAKRLRARKARVISVATIRDYWPLCPVSTRLFTARNGTMFECVDCHYFDEYRRCLAQARGRGNPLKLAAARARFSATERAARALAEVDAIVAVSEYVRRELAISRRFPVKKLISLPNLVDLDSANRSASGEWPLSEMSPDEPFMLFAGKLDYNKGPQMLADIIAQSGVTLPVVFAGDGPLKTVLKAQAEERGLDFRFYDWLDNDAVLRLMRAARVLLFPSAWQEPLSRVLLEGLAVGAAIVAMNTGGTSDAIEHGVSGWLAFNAGGMQEGVRRVAGETRLNRRLRKGAKQRAEEKFSSTVVSEEVETLYHKLLSGVGPI